jgi:ubiquitin carboxyl-terminal hydrolase 35/38
MDSRRLCCVAATGDDVQQLSNSHSSSTDSGIQSVCGDEAPVTSSSLLPFESLVQQCFGGRLLISFKCLECQAESVHTDHFRDIQLAFPPGCSPAHELHIQVRETDIVPLKTCCQMSFMFS